MGFSIMPRSLSFVYFLLLSCRTDEKIDISSPQIEALIIDQELVFSNSTLVCHAQMQEDSGTLLYKYKWTKGDGTIIGDLNTVTLSSSLIQPEEELTCSVVVRNSNGLESIASVSRIIQNTEPVIEFIEISPHQNVGTQDNLSCSAVVSDVDGTEPSITYSWRLGDIELLRGNQIDLGDFSVTEYSALACLVEANDIHGGEVSQSEYVHFFNTPPVITSVEIDPFVAHTDSDLTCTVHYIQTSNGEQYTISYEWERNGVVLENNTNMLPAPHSVEDLIACTAQINDGTQDGEAVRTEIVISNDLPVISAVSITPSVAYADSILTCTGDGFDPNQSDLTRSYQWKNSNNQIIGAHNIISLSPSMASVGDVLFCEFSLIDTMGGESKQSSSVRIQNTAPEITSVSTSHARVVVGDEVLCMGEATDLNSDLLSWTYVWRDATGNELGVGSSLVITAENSTRNELLFCEATVTDGVDSVSHSTAVSMQNSAPSISSIAINPSPGHSFDTYQCVVQTFDPDLDTISLLYSWTIDGIPQQSTSDTLYPPFAVGSQISCSAIPDDGDASGVVQSSITFVQNTPPTIGNITIIPNQPLNNSLLSCSGEAEDVDIDPALWSTDLNIIYAWYNGSGVLISNEQELQLYPDFADTGDSFQCTATVVDPQGGAHSISSSVSVVNSEPFLSEPAFVTPTELFVGDIAYCFARVEDAQDGELEIVYSWKNQNGDVVGTESYLEIDASNSDPGDVFWCHISATDSSGASVVDDATISILNTPPTIDGVTITPTKIYSDTTGISCVDGPSFDADGDNVEVSYTWFKDGILLPNTTADLVTSFVVGTQFQCKATPNDGREDGGIYSATKVVSNHEPVISSVTITPNTNITVGETLYCSSSATDADGHSLTTTYRWWDVNGTLLSTDSALTLTSDTTFPGSLHCDAIVEDGHGGVVQSRATVQVKNSTPQWTSVASLIVVDASGDSTTTAFTQGTVTCLAAATDDDDGALIPTYSWKIAGVEIATGSVWTIDPDLSNVGDTLICEASATDTYGATITSTTSITISNTLPSAVVSITPFPASVVDSLTCSVTGLDPDKQTLTYSYTWVRNEDFEDNWANQQTVSGSFARGDEITCIVTPYDGLNFGEPSDGSTIISNAIPVVETIVFDSTEIYTEDTISVAATGSDSDNEPLTFLYEWFVLDAVSGTSSMVQSGSPNTLDGSLFSKNDVVSVMVYASDSTDQGEGVLSEEITILNTPPQPPKARISPQFPVDDEALVCSVEEDSLDIDSDTISYSYSWTKNGEVFSDLATTETTGDTVPASELMVTDKWVCTITPNDETDDGATAETYITIGGGNVFNGNYETVWERVQASPSNLFSLMTYRTTDFPVLWNGEGSYLSYYDPNTNTWDYIDAQSPYSGFMKSMAPVQDMLYMVRNQSIYRFDPNIETWYTLNVYSGGDDLNQTTSDYQGHLYGHAANGDIVEYDIATDTVQQYPTGMGSLYETRLSYDPTVDAVFFGAYNSANLYKFDLNTHTVSTMTSIPEAPLSTIFCGDRSGHIYAAGGYFGKTMYQYTIATDSWSQLPDLLDDHGNNGSCTVSEDGFLYVGTGSLLKLQRLPLEKN